MVGSAHAHTECCKRCGWGNTCTGCVKVGHQVTSRKGQTSMKRLCVGFLVGYQDTKGCNTHRQFCIQPAHCVWESGKRHTTFNRLYTGFVCLILKGYLADFCYREFLKTSSPKISTQIVTKEVCDRCWELISSPQSTFRSCARILTSRLPPDRACIAIFSRARADMRTLQIKMSMEANARQGENEERAGIHVIDRLVDNEFEW